MGQIILLSNGLTHLSQYKLEAMEEAYKKGKEKGSSSRTQDPPRKHRSWKEMTGAEYMEHINRVGGGRV